MGLPRLLPLSAFLFVLQVKKREGGMNNKFARFAYVYISIVHIYFFYPLEVVSRGSETQFQVGKKKNAITRDCSTQSLL